MARADRASILESAIKAVEGVLTLDILPAHKRKLIDRMIWTVTEVDGKFKTRYQSLAAVNCDRSVKRQHEHVIPRGVLTDAILAQPSAARKLMSGAVACVVTVDEHLRLSAASRHNRALEGWERYRKARIVVIDTVSGRRFRFPRRAPRIAQKAHRKS